MFSYISISTLYKGSKQLTKQGLIIYIMYVRLTLTFRRDRRGWHQFLVPLWAVSVGVGALR